MEPGTEVLLGPDDLEDCLALDRLSLDGLWSREQWRTELEDPHRPGFAIRRQGHLVAMACGWLVLDELTVTLVAVEPCWRGQGLGSRLLRRLLRAGRSAGARAATLEVASGNTAARALYSSVGFSIAGRRKQYYRNGDDALIAWLQFSDPPLTHP